MNLRMLIDGKLVEGAASSPVINPATGRPFADAPRADGKQLDAAVAGAKRAFPAWAALSAGERGAYLERFAAAIEARAEEFKRLITMEQGKPLLGSAHEVGGTCALLKAHRNSELPPVVLRDTPEMRIIEHRTPLGVVAAITPWNVPLLLLAMKIAPALAAGNTVVAKPAPTTPLTTLLLGEVAAGVFPAGVFNVIVDANDLGQRLTSHPDVAMVSFTGSVATGRKVLESGAGTLKRITLELGGNDAAIVLADADIKAIAPKVFHAAMINSGQVCLAAKRIYAHSSVYDALCDELARIAGEVVMGDGLEQGTQYGPLQNAMQYAKVKDYFADAHAHGTVIAGGVVPEGEGYFLPPTIVRDIDENSRLVREEQFGPIVPVLRFDDIDELIERVNATEFGLGGTIWTSQPEAAIDLAKRIDTGTLWINKHMDLPFDVPMRGVKQSGIGAEMGLDGLKEFTQAKIINASLAQS